MTESLSTLAGTGSSSAPWRAGDLPSSDFRRTVQFFNALSIIDEALDSHNRFLDRGPLIPERTNVRQVQETLIEGMRRAFDLGTRHGRGEVDRASLPEWVNAFSSLIGPLLATDIPAAVSAIIETSLLELRRLAAPLSAENTEKRRVPLVS